MTRILFVTYSGLLGGAEHMLLECAAGIDGAHALICPAGELAEAAEAAGLTVYRVPERSLRLRGGIGRGLRASIGLTGHALELRRLAADLNPDLVVAWGMRSALAALAMGGRTRYAFAHHDFLPGPVVAAAVRAAAARAQVVTVPSRAVADDLASGRRRPATRLAVVPPGIDPERYAAVGPPPDAPALLVLGAIAPYKQPDLALEILARARRELPDLTLRLVGAPVTPDEPLLARLRARAAGELSGAVTLPGPVADIRPELERASCLLHCASAEPFGIVLLEAMAAGRPVVAADGGGPREIIDATCGRLYRPGDAAAAAASVVEVLSAPGLAAELGQAGRRRVRGGFTRARTRQGFASALAPALRRSTHRGAGGAEPARLGVVTVTHNSAPELARLLASVKRHLPGTSVIVVDCNSTDDTLAVAACGPQVRVIALGDNVGFGRGCNRGLGEIATPTTALLNPDVELVDDSLLRLADEALREDRPERLLAPLVLGGDGRRQQTVHPVPSSATDLVGSIVPPGLVPGPTLAPWRARSPRRVGWAVGAALLARTSTLRRLGPFDESIFMYGEDMDLGLRAGSEGVATWFWPDARVCHSGAHAATRAFGGEAFERLARARHDTVRRRLGPGRAHFDDLAQGVTFASRAALKQVLGRPSARERRQLAALRSLRRESG